MMAQQLAGRTPLPFRSDQTLGHDQGEQAPEIFKLSIHHKIGSR